ncbi:HdeD family acid-resistance protein [Mycolicibacillus trivialis]|uniref:HdeD family acid-resistance protein n=1 Tax=Mycolicibacillus trivialis TaxID=1798 RepID=UPI000D6A7C66|nr:HdeD family acid-resistance protein [Mycolicibacillus trivialis]
MQTNSVPSLLPHLWKSTLVSGLLALVLGVLVLVLPGESIVAAAILFGAYLLVTGIAQVIFAFSLPITAGGRVLSFISGAASVILAVLAFRHFGDDPSVAIWLLAIWVGIGFILRGTAATVSAISDPELPGRGWTIFLGVVSLLAGVVMLASPFASLVILTLVTGSWLIVIGIFEIISAVSMRGAAKRVDRVLAPR